MDQVVQPGRPIIKVEKIIKRYPIGDREVEILHGLDLEIFPGEFVMLIGPSGCGKSTFMYIMFGLELPTTGKVWFGDVDVYALNDKKRTALRSETITMIHQQPIWIKALTVKENVAFPLLLRRTPKNQAISLADKILKILHLEHLGEKHPHELSVGEQQRCSFMRSLISNPQMVFADEPTGNLDTDSGIVVMELFKRINEELGKTVVMVTHNLNHLPYASKVVSLLDGRIVKVETRHSAVNPQPPKIEISKIIDEWIAKRESSVGENANSSDAKTAKLSADSIEQVGAANEKAGMENEMA